jgi:acetyltransferase-like isoleucine patch superfamily enzyme
MIGSDSDWVKVGNSFVHKTAIVESWVELGQNCVIHPYAIVGRLPSHSKALARQPNSIRELQLGDRVEIGSHAVIFGGVKIEDDTLIGDFAHIREQVEIGKRCVIGRYVAISYESKISDDCRFQDNTVLTGIVGKGCFFGVGVVTSNDRRIDLKDYKYERSKIQIPVFGERVMVGSGANVLAGVIVGDDVVIGAGALVIQNVEANSIVFGSPAIEYVKGTNE